MKAVTVVGTLSCILALTLVACGSSDSGPAAGGDGGTDAHAAFDSGRTPCDAAGLDPSDGGRRCTLAMPVTGGLTGTLDGQTGCGDGTLGGGAAVMNWDSSTLGGQVTASFAGALPTQPGTYPLTSLKISSTSGGVTQSWAAPSGACTVTVTNADVECQAVFQQFMTIVYGTGTCTQAAAPETGTTAAPVTIGDFQFEHWL